MKEPFKLKYKYTLKRIQAFCYKGNTAIFVNGVQGNSNPKASCIEIYDTEGNCLHYGVIQKNNQCPTLQRCVQIKESVYYLVLEGGDNEETEKVQILQFRLDSMNIFTHSTQECVHSEDKKCAANDLSK